MARITGLATGLDVDTIVQQTMQAYRIKIDTQQQQKDILEIKQKLYRDVIKDAQELYNKHFDILKSGSLISSKTWQSVKFDSKSPLLTVTGDSSAKLGNYTVSGTKARAGKVTLKDLEKTIVVNGKEFKVEGSNDKEKASNLNKALSNAGLNISVRYTQFEDSKGNSGFVFESKVLGKNNNFTIGGVSSSNVLSLGDNPTSAKITGLTVDILKKNGITTEDNKVNKVTFKIDEKELNIDITDVSTNKDIEEVLNESILEKGYIAEIDDSGNITLYTTEKGNGQTSPIIKIKDKETNEFNELKINFIDGLSSSGVNATGATITGLKVSELKENAEYINLEKHEEGKRVALRIGDDVINIDIADVSTNKDIKNLINKALSGKGYTVDVNDSEEITFVSNTKASGQKSTKIMIKDKTSKEFVEVKTTFNDGNDATSAKFTLDTSELDKNILINGVSINLSKLDLSEAKSEKEKNSKRVEYINKILSDQNVKITASISIDSNKIVLQSDIKGESSKINFSILDGGVVSSGGVDAKFTIEDDKGGTYIYKGVSNTVSLDGMTFNFTADIPEENKVSIGSKSDSSEIVNKVKEYIEDYNKLIIKINTLVTEKRDRSYQPLTADQKKEMSETEIELWESKVKQGQLKGDSDLTRIANSLKQGMKSLVSGTGLTLLDIGIESVQDYGGTKDGTFKIDGDKLKKAIEDDIEGVMKLFMQSPQTDALENDKYNQSGIMIRLKEILNEQTVKSSSTLLQKVGFEGTITVTNNTLTKSMNTYAKKILEMENIFSRKEQALYSQYAKLETLMNTYNNQMSYLSQSLGLNS